MSNKTFHNVTRSITARPRSKRLREAGGYYAAMAVGKDSSNAGQEPFEGSLNGFFEEMLDENGTLIGIKVLHDMSIIQESIDGEDTLKNITEILRQLDYVNVGTDEDPVMGLVISSDIWIEDENEDLVNISSAIRNLPLINAGTEENPIWTIDISSYLIKTDAAYESGQSAPSPTDNLVYSALKAKELFIDDDDIIKSIAYYTARGESQPAATNANVYSALAVKEAFISAVEDSAVTATVTFLNGIKFGNYVSDSSGGAVYKDNDNAWHIEADYFHVRRKFTAQELEVQRMTHVGGVVIISSASMICSKVEEYTNYYRCYFNRTDADGRTIYNQFAVNDLARMQTFNMGTSSSNASNRFYWRKVKSVGDNYIDLSKQSGEYASGSDAPMAGDHIVQLGNTSNAARRRAIIESSYSVASGENVPFIRVYTGISGFSLPNPSIDINPVLTTIKGQFVTSDTGVNLQQYMSNVYTTANTAATNASQALSDASGAQSTADTAATNASTALSDAATALQTAQAADRQAGTNASAISSLDGTVSNIAAHFDNNGHLTELGNYVLTSTLTTWQNSKFDSNGSLKELTGYVQTSSFASLVSTYLNSNGYINSTAGLVVTSGSGANAFATLYSSAISQEGFAVESEIKTWVNGQISGITLTADKIIFNGYTIINSHFQVDNAGNLKLFGSIEAMNTIYSESGINYAFRAVGNSYFYGDLYQVAGSGKTTLQGSTASITGTSKLTLYSGTEVYLGSGGQISLEGKISLLVHEVSSGTSFTLSTMPGYHYFLMTQSGTLTFNLGTPVSGQIIIIKQCGGAVQLATGSSNLIRKGSQYVGGTNNRYEIGDGRAAILVGMGTSYWSLIRTDSL